MRNILNRLTLAQKLGALGLFALGLAAPPLAIYLNEAHKAIAVSQLEAAGVAPVQKLLAVVQLVQQHRAISALVLAGNAEMAAKREAKQAEVAAAIAAVQGEFASAGGDTPIAHAWPGVTQNWQSLRNAVSAATIAAPESFRLHSALIAQLFEALDGTADYYGLSLDPDADGYHLINAVVLSMPSLIEAVGQARAIGIGMLTRHQATAQERTALQVRLMRIDDGQQRVSTEIAKTFDANPALRPSLGNAFADAAAGIKALRDLAQVQVVDSTVLDFSSTEYFRIFTAAIDQQIALNQLALGGLSSVLDARVAQQKAQRLTMLGAMAAATLVIVALAYGLLRSIRGSLTQSVTLAGAISRGKLDNEITVHGRDELAQLLSALQRMQDDLRARVESERRVADEIGDIVQAAVQGDLARRIALEGKEGFFKQLADNINQLLVSSSSSIHEVAHVLEALAKGDLTESMRGDFKGAFAKLRDDANATVAQLAHSVNEIKQATGAINTAAREIASGNADLSQRTEQQAASLEETASSMEELTSTVKQNAENAKQANQLAIGASDIAVKGGQVVSEVVTTMSSINDASRKIADIIGVIDGIAFQTNILALNAAVEAARAGEQGRGFAVVASEVRSLAQRSAGAAKEIKTLIGDSVSRVDVGTKLVGQAGQTMNEIVTSVKRVTDIMREITAASQEQSSGIEQVNQAITQMDEVTQQNAALVEEASAAARSLEEQTASLATAVSVFKLAEGAHGSEVKAAAAARPAPKPAPKPPVPARPAASPRAPVRAVGPVAAKRAMNGHADPKPDEQWSEF